MNSSRRIFTRIVVLSRSIACMTVAWMTMAWLISGIVLSQTTALRAQSSNRFSLPGSLQGLAGQDDVASKIQVTGRIDLTKDGTQGMLRVTARPGVGWHIYSVTQQDGGPTRTDVVLDAGAGPLRSSARSRRIVRPRFIVWSSLTFPWRNITNRLPGRHRFVSSRRTLADRWRCVVDWTVRFARRRVAVSR